MSTYKVPAEELQLTFSRSSGAGGQNINKVNTKVTLTWNVADTLALPHDVVSRFMKVYANKILEDGTFVMTSQRHRSQNQNIEDCLEKLQEMIDEVAVPPKKRRPTRPTRSSVKRRLDGKRRQSDKKRDRSESDW